MINWRRVATAVGYPRYPRENPVRVTWRGREEYGVRFSLAGSGWIARLKYTAHPSKFLDIYTLIFHWLLLAFNEKLISWFAIIVFWRVCVGRCRIHIRT